MKKSSNPPPPVDTKSRPKPPPGPPKAKEKQFYLQHKGYCGNCLLWWKHNNSGYTLDIREARIFTEQEADEKNRQSDMLKKWDKKLIDNVAELHVNSETI